MMDDFQLFERRAQRSILPAINIVPQQHSEGGRFGITEPTYRICEAFGIKALEFYFSPSTRKIGLKAAEPTSRNAYKITPHARGRGGVVTAARFLDSIGYCAPDRVLVDVHWNQAEHMFELVIPDGFLQTDVPVHGSNGSASTGGAA